MSSRQLERGLVIAALSLIAGCPSFTTVGSARTIDRGHLQWVTGLGAMAIRDPVADATEARSTQAVPALETGIRYGLRDRLELGAKLWALGVQTDVKVAIVRSRTREGGVSISANPAVSFEGEPTENLHSTSLHGDALVGYRVHGHEWIAIGGFVARFVTRTFTGETRHDHVIYGRIAVGVGIRVCPWLRLQPQVGLVYPFDPEGSLGVGFAGPAFSASLGFVVRGE